jgi:hypothetical protein
MRRISVQTGFGQTNPDNGCVGLTNKIHGRKSLEIYKTNYVAEIYVRIRSTETSPSLDDVDHYFRDHAQLFKGNSSWHEVRISNPEEDARYFFITIHDFGTNWIDFLHGIAADEYQITQYDIVNHVINEDPEEEYTFASGAFEMGINGYRSLFHLNPVSADEDSRSPKSVVSTTCDLSLPPNLRIGETLIPPTFYTWLADGKSVSDALGGDDGACFASLPEVDEHDLRSKGITIECPVKPLSTFYWCYSEDEIKDTPKLGNPSKPECNIDVSKSEVLVVFHIPENVCVITICADYGVPAESDHLTIPE